LLFLRTTGGSRSMKASEAFDVYKGLIPDFQDFLEALAQHPPTAIRVNTLLAPPEMVVRQLRADGVLLEPTALGDLFWTAPEIMNPGHLWAHLMGLVYTQSLSSGLPPLALDPKPEDLVLDLCAAPGSKTTQMAQQMENRGRIIANEPSPRRQAPLSSNIRRLGVSNTIVTAYQGQDFPMRWRFKKVLVDAPCSGEGNARIAPSGEMTGFKSKRSEIERIQERLLLRAFDLLEEGGTLVYATCTYDPKENEAIVAQLLTKRPARLLPIPLEIPHDPGITSWEGVAFHEDLVEAWRIYPHRIPTVGFFLAKVGRV
jgi:tRNA (cytosine49-C5)-methyltransferase